MVDPRNKFTQPDDDTPFGRHLEEVTMYLNIRLPSFNGTFSATLPEEERWKIKVWVPGRTFAPTTKPIDFYLDAPSWSIGKSMVAHITLDAYVRCITRSWRIPFTRYVGAEMSNGR